MSLPFDAVLVRLFSRLELGNDAGEALRQRVMDLTRQTLALVEHTGFPRLGQQLDVQPSVLLQCGLQVGDQLPPLRRSHVTFSMPI